MRIPYIDKVFRGETDPRALTLLGRNHMHQHEPDFSGINLRGLLGKMRRDQRTPAEVHAERPGVSPKVRARRRKRNKAAKLSRRANRG